VTLASPDVGDVLEELDLEATLVVFADGSLDIGGSQASGLQDILQLAKAIRPDVNTSTHGLVTKDF
jgi:hypothetical protein